MNRNIIEKNSRIWDERSACNDTWSIPVTKEMVFQAKEGNWHIVLTPTKPVPPAWFPPKMKDSRILCLASGGGQQGPILAAVGAKVTVFDNSSVQLSKDRMVAERDGLNIETIQGDMQDWSVFENETFDCIVHPWSNGYIPNVRLVWKECARVLKKNGLLLSGFGNPVEYIFNPEQLEKGVLSVEHSIPYADVDHLSDPYVRTVAEREGYIWSHTLEDQIQGQIEAGFAIVGFYEDKGGTALDRYMMSSMATKAIKL